MPLMVLTCLIPLFNLKDNVWEFKLKKNIQIFPSGKHKLIRCSHFLDSTMYMISNSKESKITEKI